MTAYDVGKLMSEARRLAADYHRATGETLPLSNEIARYDAMRLLGLAAPETAQPGVDAIGEGERSGITFQIKGRVVFPDSRSKQRVGQLGMEGQWQRVVLVLMDQDYEATEVIEVTREALVEALRDIKPNKRGAMSVSRFRSLGHIAWQREQQAA